MAYTQADLDRLDRAIVSEELEVEVDGQRVRYRTTAELMAARQHVAAVMRQAAAVSSGGGSSFRFNFTTGRE